MPRTQLEKSKELVITPQTPRDGSPFDRIGVLALVWAGVFTVVAAGLSVLLG